MASRGVTGTWTLIEAEVIVTRPWALAGLQRQVIQVWTPIFKKAQRREKRGRWQEVVVVGSE